MTPPALEGCNYLILSPFLPIFSSTSAPRAGLHLLFEHHYNGALPQKQRANPTLIVRTPRPAYPIISERES
jgi:hypothetical protein